MFLQEAAKATFLLDGSGTLGHWISEFHSPNILISFISEFFKFLCHMQHVSTAAIGRNTRLLKFLTYNIWFDQLHRYARTSHICNLLQQYDADVVCLQEVTTEALDIFQRHSWLAQTYTFATPSSVSESWYFVTMLVKKELRPNFDVVFMPTDMERNLLVATLILDSRSKLMVGTAHFESLDSRFLRREQLKCVAKVFQNSGAWVLCGDFNFCSYQNYGGRNPHDLENHVLQQVLPPHVDAWQGIYSDAMTNREQRGYTYDSERNANIEQFEQMRYDRIICSVGRCRPVRAELVGTELLDSVETDSMLLKDDFLPARPQKVPKPLCEMTSLAQFGSATPPIRPSTGDPATPRHEQQNMQSHYWPTAGSPVPLVLPEAHIHSSESVLRDETASGGSDMRTPPKTRVIQVHPSDHFGIICDIEIANE